MGSTIDEWWMAVLPIVILDCCDNSKRSIFSSCNLALPRSSTLIVVYNPIYHGLGVTLKHSVFKSGSPRLRVDPICSSVGISGCGSEFALDLSPTSKIPWSYILSDIISRNENVIVILKLIVLESYWELSGEISHRSSGNHPMKRPKTALDSIQ